MEAPPRPAPPSWSALEDCGDSFENVLALLPPADVAACRLVSRAWRRQVSVLLQHLQPAAGTPPGAVAAAFPHLARLQLTATSTGRSSSRGGGGGDEASALPPLWPLPQLRRLRRLKLQGLPAEPGSLLDCAELLPLASALAFDDLEAACLELRNASALQQLAQLTRLHLAGPRLGDWRGSLPALLAPLRRLAHLHFACVDSSAAGGSSSDCGEEEPGDEPGPFGSAGQLAGLRRLTTLVTLELACPDGASDAACWEVAAGPLPRLRRLSISHSASFGQAAPAVSDAGLELVCRRLGGQLTSLTLAGHARITDAGVAHLAQLRLLQHLELRLGGTDDWWVGWLQLGANKA